jgi:hypothetical protein
MRASPARATSFAPPTTAGESAPRDRIAPTRDSTVFETRGPAGLLLALPLRLRMRYVSKALRDDLKHYAEHGTPSPRKRRRLAKRHAAFAAERSGP